MLEIDATIIWKGIEEGGLTQQPFSGIQPSFAVGGDLIMCSVFRKDGEEEMFWEKGYAVTIKLPYGEVYQSQIKPGMKFNLNVGARIVGTGIIHSVLQNGEEGEGGTH